MRAESADPEIRETSKGKRTHKALSAACGGAHLFTSLRELYAKLDINLPQQPAKQELISMLSMLEGLGFGVVPDLRHHKIRLNLASELVVFPYEKSTYFFPSKRFYALSAVVILGAIMSRTDGEIHPEEIKQIKGLIDNDDKIKPLEYQYLDELIFWSLNVQEDAALATNWLKPALKELSAPQRARIAQFLINVLYADHKIHPQEVTKLEKFYTELLGLAAAQAHADIHNLDTQPTVPPDQEPAPDTVAKPVTVLAEDEGEQPDTYGIPKPPEEESVEGVTLDPVRLAEVQAATEEVLDTLAPIFTPDNEEDRSTEPNLANEKPPAATSSDPLLSLAEKYRDLVTASLAKDSWRRTELENLCRDRQLMLNATLEVINEWALEHYGDNLLFEDEDGDRINVNDEITKELQNVRSP